MAMLHPSNPFFDSRSRSRGMDHPSSPPISSNISQPRRSSTTSPSKLPPNYPYCTLPTTKPTTPPKPTTPSRSSSITGPYSTSTLIERPLDPTPPNDAEIIIATVRVTDSFRRASVEGSSDLPSRPPRRGFLRRVTTRITAHVDECKYTALKMPRSEYKKFFARDRDGAYVGSEPERDWTRDDLDRLFGRFQEMALRSIPPPEEGGEKEGQWWVEKRNDSVLG